MSMGSIYNLSSYLQSALTTAIQGTGLSNQNTGNSLSSVNTSSLTLPPDNSQLSPFAQMMSTLQQLQQSDPTKYGQVTQQIATNLQTAAQNAQSAGNTTAANQLNQLSTDFSNASKTGQLPSIQDLAQAIGGGHHHHHHHAHVDADSSSSANGTSSTGPTSNSILSAFQTGASQNDSLNPLAIISSTLSNAGITN
ncbi:hypothetical protein SBA3_3190003 [Candidatus Sulfopaludibacter sp. SbA3]|nr:hypothetical protein SBA3_3190003 [Candidatus Sulfopaludibacter sp. SbA3]